MESIPPFTLTLLILKWVELICWRRAKRKPRSLLTSAHEQHACVYMWTVCVGHVGWWHHHMHPPSQPRQLKFSPVSHAQFHLNTFSCQNLSESRGKVRGESMSAGDIFKVETVFIADPVEGGAGSVPQPKITNEVSPHDLSCTMSWGAKVISMYLLISEPSTALLYVKATKSYIRVINYIDIQ